jgi:hypothetical protein
MGAKICTWHEWGDGRFQRDRAPLALDACHDSQEIVVKRGRIAPAGRAIGSRKNEGAAASAADLDHSVTEQVVRRAADGDVADRHVRD